ncbi:MAG: Spy/CpxP family protein refolding chaperone [Myxococcota bacterium]
MRGHEGALFGVRRPLRFMAHKLDLDESQVRVLARILDELKTERAQARVDEQRTISGFAEAMDSETFDAECADQAAQRRVETAERLKAAVLKALKETHAMLDERQRSRLAYMLRSGVLTI